MTISFRRTLPASLAVTLAALAGCDRAEPEYYEVPGAHDRAAATEAAARAMADQPSMFALAWDLPAGWEDVEASGARLASFAVPGGAEGFVVEFPPNSGSATEFADMLGGMIGLPPLEPGSDLVATTTEALGGRRFTRFTVTPEDHDQAALGAIYGIPARQWLFAVTGPRDAVLAAADDFTAFLASLRLGAPGMGLGPTAAADPKASPTAPVPAPDTATAPAGTTQMSELPPGARTGADALTWQPPGAWAEGAASTFRKGSYLAADGQVDIAITSFPGDVGGMLANVNRWRQQLGLPPVSSAELPGLLSEESFGEFTFTIVDLNNPQTGQATLAAILPYAGDTWFFKMSGPSNAVAAEAAHLRALLASVAER